MVKNFRKIPNATRVKINSINGDACEVRSTASVGYGSMAKFRSLGLTIERLQVGETWVTLPLLSAGITSRRNIDGWEIVRKDLPKYTKTFCHEIPNFGDGSRNGWSTVCQDREVYHRDEYPPPLHELIVCVDESLPDGQFGISFTVSRNFDKKSSTFEEDILFAINLLKENFGAVDIVSPSTPRSYHTESLNWEVFPPGKIEEVITWLKVGGRISTTDQEKTARERLALFEKYRPTSYIKGLGGSDTYIGARYADDLVVFENLRPGNALYVLYEDWEKQSKVPRSELLKLSGNKFDRIIHRKGWSDNFKGLMNVQLKKRNLSLVRR